MGFHTYTIDYPIPPAVGRYSESIILKVPEAVGPPRALDVIEALLTLMTVFTSLAGEVGAPHPHFRCGRV